MQTVAVTDNTFLSSQTPSNYFGRKKMSKFNPPKKEKIFIKCAHDSKSTYSMCERYYTIITTVTTFIEIL